MRKKTKKQVVVERRELVVNIILGIIFIPIFIWLNLQFVEIFFNEIGSVYSDGTNGSEDLDLRWE